jgi:hypothetical protein
MMVAAVTGVPREVGTAEGKQAAAVATAGRTTERQAGRRVAVAWAARAAWAAVAWAVPEAAAMAAAGLEAAGATVGRTKEVQVAGMAMAAAAMVAVEIGRAACRARV